MAELTDEKEPAEKEEASEAELPGEEGEAALERVYTIPLERAWIGSKRKRVPRALRIIRDFLDRHMKPESLVISPEVNVKVWEKGIEKPPRRIRVRATKDREGTVVATLAEGD